MPFTDAWWQFPIFYPAADVLAFSEHLLGVSVIAAPLDWLTGNPVVAANLTSLATFPLCALAAFALARHLTGSSVAAFVAGLVYGFGPYRMAPAGAPADAGGSVGADRDAGAAPLSSRPAPRAGSRSSASRGCCRRCPTATRCSSSRSSSACGCCGSSCCGGCGTCAVSIALATAAGHAFRWCRSCPRTWRCTRATASRAAPSKCARSAPMRWGSCARRSRSAPGAGCAMPACRRASSSRASSPGCCSLAGFLVLRRSQPGGWSDQRWLVVRAGAGARLRRRCNWPPRSPSPSAGPWNLEWGPISAHAASAARPFMFALVALGLALVSSPGFRGALWTASAAGVLPRGRRW